MNKYGIFAIIGLGAAVGLGSYFADDGRVQVDDYHMSLLVEVQYHCERLSLDHTDCGTCDSMRGQDAVRCNAAKLAVEREFHRYVGQPNRALDALQREVDLAAERNTRKHHGEL